MRRFFFLSTRFLNIALILCFLGSAATHLLVSVPAAQAECDATDDIDLDDDNDGLPNCEDLCPADRAKIDPGECGCGMADVDSDRDGQADCIDQCPSDSFKTEALVCGCGFLETFNFNEYDEMQCDDPEDLSTYIKVSAVGRTAVSVRFTQIAGSPRYVVRVDRLVGGKYRGYRKAITSTASTVKITGLPIGQFRVVAQIKATPAYLGEETKSMATSTYFSVAKKKILF